MPELMPCPDCGQAAHVIKIERDNNKPPLFTCLCRNHPCVDREAFYVSEDAAIAAWNALPRALRWTHEPPKVEGLYWCRVSKLYQPSLVDVYDSEDGLRFESGEGWRDQSIAVESGGFEWAGPIPTPIEP